MTNHAARLKMRSAERTHILPVSNIARMLMLVEGTTGIFYMTILVARLVGLYSSGKG